VAVERHGEVKLPRTLLLQLEECVGIHNRVRADGEGQVVAAQFALVTDSAAQPPNGGMEEEQRFGHGLNEVPEEVSTADVGQLVR
jgi:hypothetical protein